MKTGTLKKLQFVHLKQLPRDQQVLDYIKERLIAEADTERKQVVAELLEMHRTSEGFDPLNLCKARVSRVKSTVIRKILFEVDAEVGAILESIAFREFVARSDSSARLFQLFQIVKSKIQRNDFTELEKQISELKELVSLSSRQDLLIALYKTFNSRMRDRNPEPEIFLKNIKT